MSESNIASVLVRTRGSTRDRIPLSTSPPRRSRLILFPARANGVAFDAVLDTGNGAPSTFLLGSRFAERSA